MTEKIIPPRNKSTNQNIESLHDLEINHAKNYKTFIPQSKILKKVEFQKQLQFYI